MLFFRLIDVLGMILLTPFHQREWVGVRGLRFVSRKMVTTYLFFKARGFQSVGM
jgi:hypothetical protein